MEQSGKPQELGQALPATSSSEQASYRLQVSELVDNSPSPGVQEEVVALLTVTCAFKNFGRDKTAGLGRLSRDMAADFPKNALHSRNGFRVEFAHLYSFKQPQLSC